MRIPERASNAGRAAWSLLKALLTIGIAITLLTIGFLPWRTLIQYDAWDPFYEYQTAIQWGIAAFAGFCPAMAIYFGVTERSFVATTVSSFIFMSVTAVLGVLFGVAEERLGTATIMGIIGFPLSAAVATKAAKLASQKKSYTNEGRKFKDSFNEAMHVENLAELLLWTIAWASAGLGVFLLIKAIEMW